MGVVVPRVEVEQENVFDAKYTINHNKILIDGHASARKSEICRHCCPLTGNDRFMPHCLIIIQIAPQSLLPVDFASSGTSATARCITIY